MTDESKSYTNGVSPCRMSITEWDEWKESMERIQQTHAFIGTLHDPLSSIDNSLKEMKNGMMGAILGREIVPIGVAQQMLAEQRKTYLSIIKTMSWVFGAIILAILGLKYLAPHLLG